MNRKITPMNRNWRYKKFFNKEYIDRGFDDKEFTTVDLPHTNKENPYNYFDEKMNNFVSCYRNTFSLDELEKGSRIFIDFEGVMTYAKVYINGKYLGEHKGGYTPFSFELTGMIDFNTPNVLAVTVDSTERPDVPPFGNVLDYLTYGGIYREVSLRIVSWLFIENVFAKPINVLQKDRKLSTDIYIDNGTESKKDIELSVTLKSDDLTIKECRQKFNIGVENKSCCNVVMDGLNDIKLWDIDTPNLYTVEVKCITENVTIDEYITAIGFREAKVTENGFFLNGNKLMIRGLNRHQSFPYVGYAMPERVQKQDADILKYQLNLNTVRTSHYPQSRHFLDRCDEIGLLVLEEIPGWNHIGDEEWKDVACENVSEMIKRDWNHPSIFLWGVRINESEDDHDFYTRTNAIAHQLDDSRQTGGIRCIRDSELLEDVYTMNDFTLNGAEKVLKDQKTVTGLEKLVPYIVTEFNGHMFPTKRFDQEERLIEHAVRHLRVHNAAGVDENISGAIGWCAFDYNTHFQFGSGDRICYHGVMDMFRIPKLASGFYKSQVSPDKEFVLEPMTIWTRGERNEGGVNPIVVFTNCDGIKLSVSGKIVGSYKADKEVYKGVEYPPIVTTDVVGFWGGNWDNAEFVGYIGGKEVIRKVFLKDPVATALKAEADDATLSSEKPDATRIVYKVVDQIGNLLPFIPDYIEFNISGPGEIIGPTKTSLIGGCIAVWVKSIYKKGEIILSAKSSRFSADDVHINVS